jgi:hypothetical protein
MDNASDIIANALVSADLAEFRGDFAHLPENQLEILSRGLQKLGEGDVTGGAAVSAILDRSVRMPIYRWEDARNAFDQLARKAAVRGLPVPTLEEVSRETIGEGAKAEVWVTARILGAAPVLNGWRCVATLTETVERDELGKAIAGTELLTRHVASGQVFDDDGATMRCDHCGFSRKRQLVFVLRHENGDEMFVGSTCLNEYLGTDALGAWFVWSRLHEISKRMDGWSSWDLADHASWLADHPEVVTRGAGSNRPPIPTDMFLAACIAEIREVGYVSKAQERRRRYNSEIGAYEEIATGPKVWNSCQTGEHTSPTQDDHKEALKIIEWIGTFDPDEIDHRTYEPSYQAGLVHSLDRSRTGVHLADAAIVASAVDHFNKTLEYRRELASWSASYVPGEAGDQVVLSLTVIRLVTWALVCSDASNRQILVKSHYYRKTDDRIVAGDQILVSGRIRKFGQWNGVWQTIIGRPSVYRAEEDASPALRKKAREMYDRLGEPTPEWAQKKSRRKKSQPAALTPEIEVTQ